MNAPPAMALETIGISKRFGIQALADVSINVRAGAVHALLGENGAGKSTLVKCVMGFYKADSGSMRVDGRQVSIAEPRQAHAHGLGMVQQHVTLAATMTVTENLVLARAALPIIVGWKQERERLADFMSRMPFSVPLDARGGALAAGEKQKVEILKELYRGCRLLILDEPTAALTPQEADDILGFLRQRATTHGLTILLITHKFREVLAFADTVTVLRQGRVAGGGDPRAIGADAMATMMVGAKETAPRIERPQVEGEPRLEIGALEVADDDGDLAVKGVTLAVRAGEIVGIAGASGNGQREFVDALAGQRQVAAGTIRVHGEIFGFTRAEMRRHAIGCLAEEPLRSAVVARLSVTDNMALRCFDRPPLARRGGWLSRAAFRSAARALIERYGVQTPGPDAPIATLSGGNIQRAVLARELSAGVDVLVAANPCAGLDFAAVAAIHRRIMQARNRGAAVLLVSEDLDEILALADRILVMFDGRLVHDVAAPAADRIAIGRHMAGDAHAV